MTGPSQGFDIVGLPMDTYADCADLEATAEIEAIAELLKPWGGEPVPWQTPRRTQSAVSARLGSWSREENPRNSVLLWVGHGNGNDQEANLVVAGDESSDHDDEYTPAAMARHLIDRYRQDDPYWVVVMVEACGAALFVDHLQAELLRRGAADRILLIGSGAKHGKGYLAAFRAVLARVFRDVNGNDSYISLRDLGQRIEDLLVPGSVLSKRIGGGRLVRASPPVPPVTMTLDDLSRPAAAVETALTGPPAGVSSSGLSAPGGEFSPFFVGRAGSRGVVIRWLEESEQGLLVVTGPPGCGKSAFLADLLRRASVRAPRADVALNLTGASMSQVVDSLAGQFGVDAPAWSVSDDPRVEDLLDRIDRAPERKATVVADALDAAVDPGRMAHLLRALGARPGIRVVVGTRPSTTDGLDRPPSPAEDLLDALGRGKDEVTVHRLARDPQDLAEFVRHRLLFERARFSTAEVELDEAVPRTVALIGATPASGSERDFLHTVLVVHEIIAQPELLADENRQDLAELVGRDHRSLFGGVVDRLEGVLPGSRAALRALAFTQGRGLPRAERIWATAASALGGSRVDARLLAEVAVAAAPYIMLDAEDGQAVYRMAHGAFREILLGDSAPHAIEAAHAEVTAALVELTIGAAGDEVASWRPHPYLIRHLADHAAAGGAQGWQTLAASPDVLDLLDPAAVAGAVLRFGVRLGALPLPVAGTLATAHLALPGENADRRGLRELGMGGTLAGGPPSETPDACAALEPRRVPVRPTDTWSVRWAAVPSHVPHVILTRLSHPMRSLIPLFGAAGRRLVVAAGDAGLVCAWDLATGREALPPLRMGGNSAGQSALAALGSAERESILAAAGEDSVLHQWDLGIGERPVGPVQLATDTVSAMVPVGGVLAIGDRQGRIEWVDPGTGEAIGRTGVGHGGPVQGMAVYRTGRGVGVAGERLVSVDAGGSVMVWRPGRRNSVRAWRADQVALNAVAALVGPGGEPLVATAGEDGSVRLWNPDSGTPVGEPLTGHDGAVNAVAAVTRPGAATLLASGGKDGTLRIWDPFGERPELHRLTGHRGPVNAVTGVVGPDDAVLLATAGQDGSVRLWDARGPYVPRAGDFGPGEVRAMARVTEPGGQAVLGIGAGDGVEWRDAYDGRLRSGFRSVPGGGGVSMTAVGGGRDEEFLADVGADGRIRVYSPIGSEAPRDVCLPASLRRAGSGFRLVAAVPGPTGTSVLAALTAYGELCSFDARTGALLSRSDTGLPGPFTALAALPRRARSAEFAIACRNGTDLRVFDPVTGHGRLPARGGGAGQVRALAVIGGAGGAPGILIAGGSGGGLDLWGLGALRLLHTIRLGVRTQALADLGGGDLAVGTAEGALVLTLNRELLSGG
ncbi:AAA family ATPase [Streptomyces sp. RKAG337]|uniref:AAA family ATPase n=1 Tax=Streptomyces sp. RKAG337 TaxID=2893404 RepID=UPI0020336871|nr:AAA family ATPase [Streptomyces sp. RKAG337]MCM2424908.1 hypothetical protein [Streptomyces sp. RKAG337]